MGTSFKIPYSIIRIVKYTVIEKSIRTDDRIPRSAKIRLGESNHAVGLADGLDGGIDGAAVLYLDGGAGFDIEGTASWKCDVLSDDVLNVWIKCVVVVYHTVQLHAVSDL